MVRHLMIQNLGFTILQDTPPCPTLHAANQQPSHKNYHIVLKLVEVSSESKWTLDALSKVGSYRASQRVPYTPKATASF